MADQDLLSIVWGETSGLAAKDRSDQTLTRLHAVVAKLAAAAKRRGLDGDLKRQLAPRADAAAAMVTYNMMVSTVNAVDTNAFMPPAELPERAVLWEINESGVPPRDNLPPKSLAWISDPDVKPGGDFVAGIGAQARTYRLFESAKVPTDYELPFASSYTGSGVVPSSDGQRWYRKPSWWIGLSGGVLFFLAAFSLLWTASSFSQAYDLLTNRQIEKGQKFSSSLPLPPCPPEGAADQKTCETPGDVLKDKKGKALDDARQQRDKKLYDLFSDRGPACVDQLTKWAEATRPPADPRGVSATDRQKNLDCLAMLGEAVKFAAQNLVIKADTWPGHVAQFVGWWLFGWHVPVGGTHGVSLAMPATLMMLGVILVLVGLGKGVNGTPLGALISPNGRYSLALAQVTFWTVLVLTSVMAIAIFNGGLVSEMARNFPKAVADLPNAVKNGFFPEIPTGIWGVLGISFGSTVLSALIKSIKGSDDSLAISADNTRQVGSVGMFKDKVTGYDPRHRASIADWFLGEDTDNKDKIDISRVQMVLITSGLLVTYGNAIFSAINDLTQQEILLAIQRVDILIAALPPVGTSMAAMMAVSHATYLVAKAASTTPSTTPEKPK
ncbi:hypothetical protein S58_34790 [Bradyrhizobium oligotrophicum S58]|uniref:Uncharacterized protein n=1 Tax=Bradyrhizobium oligotrophicum S58 TaxID=1245469 RepID=M4Z7X6_9BRAD|nr:MULTISPECIES: hypothetical protein [Bradyrhizobium]BAM89472.1 hypothetical protein S58_34790 [Bradyrhizobium oligotrophicum S58]